jgi:hypothetical protein
LSRRRSVTLIGLLAALFAVTACSEDEKRSLDADSRAALQSHVDAVVSTATDDFNYLVGCARMSERDRSACAKGQRSVQEDTDPGFDPLDVNEATPCGEALAALGDTDLAVFGGLRELWQALAFDGSPVSISAGIQDASSAIQRYFRAGDRAVQACRPTDS